MHKTLLYFFLNVLAFKLKNVYIYKRITLHLIELYNSTWLYCSAALLQKYIL